jgi:hypothetical protein
MGTKDRAAATKANTGMRSAKRKKKTFKQSKANKH